MSELAQAISGPALSHSDPTSQSRSTSTMDVEEMDSVFTPTLHTHLVRENSQVASSPPKPRFFLPEINLPGVDTAEGEPNRAAKRSVQDGRLLAPVGYRKLSTVSQRKQEPLRLPTPHQRLKSAFSANSIVPQSSTNPTAQSNSTPRGNSKMSRPNTSVSTSKVLNVKKASSDVELVTRPTQFYHPTLSKHFSAPKIHSQLVHASVQPAASSPREAPRLVSHSTTPRQLDSASHGSSGSVEKVDLHKENVRI